MVSFIIALSPEYKQFVDLYKVFFPLFQRGGKGREVHTNCKPPLIGENIYIDSFYFLLNELFFRYEFSYFVDNIFKWKLGVVHWRFVLPLCIKTLGILKYSCKSYFGSCCIFIYLFLNSSF